MKQAPPSSMGGVKAGGGRWPGGWRPGGWRPGGRTGGRAGGRVCRWGGGGGRSEQVEPMLTIAHPGVSPG
jgi:hypothetical protein